MRTTLRTRHAVREHAPQHQYRYWLPGAAREVDVSGTHSAPLRDRRITQATTAIGDILWRHGSALTIAGCRSSTRRKQYYVAAAVRHTGSAV
jgi:hypothetical protein